MKKVLILFAHPVLSRSIMNKTMRKAVENLDNITFHDLYASYPDFHIDVDVEQKLFETHDVIIFQHPFYWYSTPSIIKEWLDLVLQHDWAYGSRGNALKGKYLVQALTAGGDDATYSKGGANRFTLIELTKPFQATANLCKMIWLPPFAVLGIHRGLSQEKVQAEAEEYRRAVVALRDGTLNIKKVVSHKYLNSNLNAVISKV